MDQKISICQEKDRILIEQLKLLHEYSKMLLDKPDTAQNLADITKAMSLLTPTLQLGYGTVQMYNK